MPDPAIIAAARIVLEAKRDELRDRLSEREPIAVTREPDPVDDGLQLSAREVATDLMRKDRDLLRQVETALKRIDAGEYGECSSCGEPIAPKRLAAVPWAGRCLDCQELADEETAAAAAACGGLTE
jgi:RNA polymerase-binding protein DksA